MTIFSMVLLSTILLVLSRVLTVWATLFSLVLTVQASTILLVLSRVLIVWATLFSMVLLFQPPYRHRRTGDFLPKGTANHLPKKLSQVAQIFTKQSSTKTNEGHTLQQHRAYWHMKVARYSFSGSMPSKFERKLCRHKKKKKKITTSCIR